MHPVDRPVNKNVLYILAAMTATTTCLLASSALSLDRKAGPIWSQRDAGRKCPSVCRPLQ